MGRLRQLWSLAKRAKEVWEWWAILSGLLPAIAVVWAVIQGAPFDVVILYIMAGVAYVVVIVCEMSTLRELVTPKIHDGVLWKVSSSREALDGPFCPTDTTPLGHQGIHGSRRKPKTEDSDYVGGFSELICPSCTKTYQLGATSTSLRFVGESRNEAAIRFLRGSETWPAAGEPDGGTFGIVVSNQKAGVEGVKLPADSGLGTFSPSYGHVAIDVTFEARVPMLLSRVRLVLDNDETGSFPPIGAPPLRVPVEIHSRETHRLTLHVPGGMSSGTKSASILAIAGDKRWRSEPWPITFSKDITIG